MIIKDEALRNITSTVFLGSAIGASVLTEAYSARKMLKSLYENRNWRNLALTANLMINIGTIMHDLVKYYWGNPHHIKPAVLLSGIPLGTITEESYAMSNRILKFRATGGIFLAHQDDASEQSLRLVGKAWGYNRYLLLIVLDSLFKYGNTLVVDNFFRPMQEHLLGNAMVEEVLTNTGEYTTKDPWARVNFNNLDEGREEYHLTFPVITRNRIYNNMYIETYDVVESVEIGLNVLDFSIFLRKFLPSPRPKFAKIEEPDGTTVWYFHPDDDDEFITDFRLVDTLIDVGLSTAMIFYRMHLFLTSNTIEETMALVTGISLNNEVLGEDNSGEIVKVMIEGLSKEDDLIGLSISNKEELMQIG